MLGKHQRFLGAILLVSGTTIGAAMLALPATTGLAGFLPALVLMTLIWLFMMLTAFYFLEVNLRLKGEGNLISMVRATLGVPGEIGAWIIYLLLLYALTAAYMVGCSQLLEDFFSRFLRHELPSWIWPALIFLIFGLCIFLGTRSADFFNRVLMIGLGVAYILMIGWGCCRIQVPLLKHIDWKFLLPSASIIVTSFGYHIIIPTLTTYLEHDHKLLRKAIFFGSLVPFVVYVLWQALAMGVIPVFGEHSLSVANEQGVQITFFLSLLLNNPLISGAARAVAFFAIVTSLLGVSLSLSDFLADGLKIRKTVWGRFLLILITFVPPLLFVFFYPQGFILALKYAGVCVVLLLMLLPILMVWVERYLPRSQRSFVRAEYTVMGGKWLLIGAFVISLMLLIVEIGGIFSEH